MKIIDKNLQDAHYILTRKLNYDNKETIVDKFNLEIINNNYLYDNVKYNNIELDLNKQVAHVWFKGSRLGLLYEIETL